MKYMNLRALGLMLFSMSLSFGAMAAMDPNSKLIDQYFESANLEKITDETNQKMLEAQIQQVPELKQYEEELKAFINKHASFKATSKDMRAFFSENFTETEMQEMINYNNSPTGRKENALVPELATKIFVSVQKRYIEDMPGFLKSLEAKKK